MAPHKTKKSGGARSREIPVSAEENHNPVAEPLQRVIHPDINRHYELHIEAADAPDKAARAKETKKVEVHRTESRKSVHREAEQPVRTRSRIGRKIWNFMEWIAVSALIFMVLFFMINFSSYSMLLKNKLEKVTGTFRLDPYIEKIVGEDTAPAAQEPLPLTSDNEAFRTQIPVLQMEVAPPDERIIIPRMNQNVPIVQVSSENLIKRDWNALESDIQNALRDGVVHYPGTSQPGDRGNVVITGHSSYFPWDPGRFKDVFALLHEVVVGDTVVVYHDQKKYSYEVYEKKVVMPDQIEVLTQDGEDRLTLITCTPVGTNLKRLVLFARPV